MDQNTKTGDVNGISNYAAPKTWAELNSDEKIERIREQVKNIQFRNSLNERQIQKLLNDFDKHNHAENGMVTIPFNRYEVSGGLLGSDLPKADVTKVYF